MLQRGYEGDWLGGTFSRAVFLGNGLVAIVAGLVAHGLVETLSFGPVAPFDAAGVIMLLGGLVVLFSWTENYGDASNKRGFLEQLQSGARAIANGASARATINLLLPADRMFATASIFLLLCAIREAVRFDGSERREGWNHNSEE